jgi:branched-chain amino acid transport system substrate-binding protein
MVLLVVLGCAVAGCAGQSAGTIKIGVLAACEGSFGNTAPNAFAGADLALLERGAKLAGSKPSDGVEGARVGGKDVKLVFACGDDSAERALSEARRLVEVMGVDVLIGPQFPAESFTIVDYARRQPSITFVSGIVLPQAVTLQNPSPNFFRFATDAAQMQAGLGEYVYDELGWRRVVMVGDQRSYSYTQAAGFVAEFCALGGTIVKQIWVPLGTRDLSSYTSKVPSSGVDGFFFSAVPPTIPAFIDELPQLQGNLAERATGGTLLFVQEALGKRLDGVVLSALDDTESLNARAWRTRFGKTFPDLAAIWAFFPVLYYGSMKAVLSALEEVDGDLSDGQRRLQAALAKVELDIPTIGHIKLDERRSAIGPNYLYRYRLDKHGALAYTTIRKIENVEQTFNGYFKPGDPPPGEHTIACKKGNPPPWTRRR